MIKRVEVQGFRGLTVSTDLKKVNIVVGENGTGKTSFLEALFLATLFQSDMSESDITNSLYYVMLGRCDALLIFLSLTDSKVTIVSEDDEGTSNTDTVAFKKKDIYNIEVYVNEDKVAEISINHAEISLHQKTLGSIFLPLAKVIKRVNNEFFPLYISAFFDNSGGPETIYSVSRRKNKEIKSEFEILQDEYGMFRLYYGSLPAYVIGRGILKREMIKLGLTASNLLLIDEIEDSLHPDLVMQVLQDIRYSDAQVVFTTNANEVIKMASKVFEDNKVTVIYLSNRGYRTYRLSEIAEFEKPLGWLGYV